MMPHNVQTTSTPTAAEDRAAIARHDEDQAKVQAAEDARAQWLGYRSESDFTDRAASQLDRHPTLPSHIARHARFVYFGKDSR